MDAFISRKRRRISPPSQSQIKTVPISEHNERNNDPINDEDLESTDFKLALLASLQPTLDHVALLEALLAAHGSVELASENLSASASEPVTPQKKIKSNAAIGYQSSLSSFTVKSTNSDGKEGVMMPSTLRKPLTKRGRTLHLYSPQDIENNTPCSIIHNFLPAEEADELLKEILPETATFKREKFQMFERVVESPHTYCFYVNSWSEAEKQKTDYIYDGQKLDDVRATLPKMRDISVKVQLAVNREVQRRIRDFNPGGVKLKYQSPDEWQPNAAFVNCYDGGKESVGYHSDQLTYLGPRAVIGSLSLGVAREFRVRKIVAKDEEDGGGGDMASSFPSTSTLHDATNGGGLQRKSHNYQSNNSSNNTQSQADAQGQIAIHLPHNSLLIMHAEMQEEWKHSISPTPNITPHPISANKRINITYRFYRKFLHPRWTPKCKCNVPTVLRCVQRKSQTKGRYMWMCHAHKTPGKTGCNFFAWAVFDEDGLPPWVVSGEFGRASERENGGGGAVGDMVPR